MLKNTLDSPLDSRGFVRALLAPIAALALALLPACAERADPDGSPDASIRVVATTGMIADAARAIAGDRAEVRALMGPGTDPHLYTPTRTDMQRVLNADIVLYNGLLLEGKMGDALDRARTADRRVVAVAEKIDPEHLLHPEELEGEPDPHLWMDPVVWRLVVEAVRDVLIEADPDGADLYLANASAYLAELDALHEYASRVLAMVPEERRVLVTAHDAFGYFGERYAYRVLGVQGISTASEAGVRDVERLVSEVIDRGIPAVFAETSVPDRNIRAIIEGARARGHTVRLGGELFSDAMGETGTYRGTYIGMIDHNVTTIARALGADIPASGMAGRLDD
ncbi:MAG: manganese transporter [Phycisphaerales bacterium]|nr:MAG: manganese transporter [Phycisphaerales bacterium]